MQKIVINRSYGGFGLSDEAKKLLKEKMTEEEIRELHWYTNRNNQILVNVVESSGEGANGISSCLEIVEIPDEYDWIIEEYDGYESIELRPKKEVIRKLVTPEAIIDYLDKADLFVGFWRGDIIR